MPFSDSDTEREELVAALRGLGVRYLAPSDAKRGAKAISAGELISRLAGHADPRLRLALVPLFLLHPKLAEELPRLSLPAQAQATLRRHYTAAACLQRMWRTRLGFYIDADRLLPDLYSAGLGLPAVDESYGKVCLHALAEGEASNLLSVYEKAMELLFEQLKLEARIESATSR